MAKFITVHWYAAASIPVKVNVDKISHIYDEGVATPTGRANIYAEGPGNIVCDESVEDVIDLINALDDSL